MPNNMEYLTRDQVRAQVIDLLKSAREDFDSSIQITDQTGLFHDLGFESIDAIGLSSTLEGTFDQTLPFPEFMNKAKREQWKDITLGNLLDFLMANLNQSAERVAA
jgi:acyl carrier protein